MSRPAIVLVSHSEDLARGTRDLLLAMARDVVITTAAGDGEGGLGTRSEAIESAVRDTEAKELLLFFDMGSALMNAEMAVELLAADGVDVTIVDAPFVEGALAASMAIQVGGGIREAVRSANEAREHRKRQ